jgi:hypothetical protein
VGVIALAIRGAIDPVAYRLTVVTDLGLVTYGRELATLFDRARTTDARAVRVAGVPSQ